MLTQKLRMRLQVVLRGGSLGVLFFLLGGYLCVAGTALDSLPASAPINQWPALMVWLSYFGLVVGIAFMLEGVAIFVSSFFRSPEGMRTLLRSAFIRPRKAERR